jgi:4-hydroxybenzoate polyprenyltransferase
MKQVTAFFRLIRFQNLFFIALTQMLFYFCIILPLSTKSNMILVVDYKLITQIVIASVCIAAAGYIINDYFDLNIDRVNKPEKLVIESIISRRWAILWHLFLSAIGIAVTGVVSTKIHNPFITFLNILAVLLLWFYSTSYKKQLLTGNIIISLLTSWVIGILYMIVQPLIFMTNNVATSNFASSLFKFTALYAGFSFIISIIREVVKDLEDRMGDEKYGCKTMPIVWGTQATKVFIMVWLIVLIAALLIVQIYAIQLNWWWAALYGFLFTILPLVIAVRILIKADNASDYHKISTLIKWIMLSGILSMVFIKWYML